MNCGDLVALLPLMVLAAAAVAVMLGAAVRRSHRAARWRSRCSGWRRPSPPCSIAASGQRGSSP